MMDGFSDWRGQSIRSVGPIHGIFDIGVDLANQKFDCISSLDQVIHTLQNRNVMKNALVISQLKLIRARVEKYELMSEELKELKQEHQNLKQKCTSLEAQAEAYKSSIAKYEEQRQRMTE